MSRFNFAARRVTRVTVLLLVLGAGFAASALATTIHGTAKNNVIHGTVKNDTIYGLAGNDTIYGLAGNDKLYGGAGNDKLYGGAGTNVLNCGPGKDVAYAGAHDTVIGCETVHRTASAPPPPPPPVPTTTTTPVTTTTPTTTAAPLPETGTYCGFTNNSGGICFDITGSPLVFTNAHFTVSVDSNDCDPPGSGSFDTTSTGAAPLSATGAFDFPINQGDYAGTDINGTVNTTGGAAGNLVLHTVITSGGTTFTCSLNMTWTANRQ
jgi:Ca2+-binding RTX toxin-like protein